MKPKTINIFLAVLICGLSIFCAFILLNGNKDKPRLNLAKSEKMDNFTDSDESHKQITTLQQALTQAFHDETSVSNPDNTFERLLKKAEAGDADAQYKLGLMYANSDGIQQDYKEAIKWHTKAAEQGVAKAQGQLSAMHALGLGVIEDYIEAYKWALLAGMNSVDISAVKNFLKDQMTLQQKAEAQRLAKEFVAKKEHQDNKSSLNINNSIAGFGTGFFISRNGYFITAAHVVKDASSVRVYCQSNDYTAEKVFTDETLDVAVLKIKGMQSPHSLSFSSSSQVKTGNTVFTLGFPQVQLQGFEPKYMDGSIGSLSGIANDSEKYFQISVPVQPGNSGGPLMDSNGNVVGLITGRLDEIATPNDTGSLPQNVNYALKSSFIQPLLESMPDIQLVKSSKMDMDDASVYSNRYSGIKESQKKIPTQPTVYEPTIDINTDYRKEAEAIFNKLSPAAKKKFRPYYESRLEEHRHKKVMTEMMEYANTIKEQVPELADKISQMDPAIRDIKWESIRNTWASRPGIFGDDFVVWADQLYMDGAERVDIANANNAVVKAHSMGAGTEEAEKRFHGTYDFYGVNKELKNTQLDSLREHGKAAHEKYKQAKAESIEKARNAVGLVVCFE